MKTTNGVPTTVDEYIATFPSDVQDILKQVRATIKKAAPGAEETIKYQIPTFVLNENVVHFAALQNHIGFYPTPSGIEEFKRELAEYKFAKGSGHLRGRLFSHLTAWPTSSSATFFKLILWRIYPAKCLTSSASSRI